MTENKPRKTTILNRFRRAWEGFIGKPYSSMQFGLEIKRCDECENKYIEKDTECDRCDHLDLCILSGNVLDCTINEDTKKHYIRGINCECIRYKELMLENLRLMAKEMGYKLVKESED